MKFWNDMNEEASINRVFCAAYCGIIGVLR